MNDEEKIRKQLDNSSFIAYSDITADSKQLHGDVNVVVTLQTAKAIVHDVLTERNKQLQDLQYWLLQNYRLFNSYGTETLEKHIKKKCEAFLI